MVEILLHIDWRRSVVARHEYEFHTPLPTQVLSTRDAESIYAPLTLAQCANCALWTSYGIFAAKDVFVYGPNGIGAHAI